MYRTKNTPVQITVPSYREPLSGIVTTALAAGSLVAYKRSGSPQDERELIPANGVAPAILESTVLTDADWQAHMKLDPQYLSNIRTPVPVGSASSARFAHLAEFEGADFFTAITGATAVDTPLTTAAGKFITAGAGVNPVAFLNRKLTPHVSGSFRWEVRFIG